MNYKKAFKCSSCPESNTEKGCPMWWEFMQTNNVSGEEKLQKMCGYQALPTFLIEVIKASNRPAAVMESARNDMIEAVTRIPQQINAIEHKR